MRETVDPYLPEPMLTTLDFWLWHNSCRLTSHRYGHCPPGLCVCTSAHQTGIVPQGEGRNDCPLAGEPDLNLGLASIAERLHVARLFTQSLIHLLNLLITIYLMSSRKGNRPIGVQQILVNILVMTRKCVYTTDHCLYVLLRKYNTISHHSPAVMYTRILHMAHCL